MIGIFGSCVSRDLFEHPLLRPFLGHYAARSSVVSAVAAPVAIDEESVINPSAWQRRCVLADFAKTCFDEFAATTPEWLVIDLIDERFDLLRVGGSYVTRSSAFTAAGLEDREEFGFERVRRMSQEGCALFDQAARGFAERVLELVPPERVVLHRARWCTRYRDAAGVHPFPQPRIELCRNQNQMLSRGYDTLAAAFGGHAVEMTVDPERDLADAGHRWELEPFHYQPAYNQAAMARLQALVGVAA